MKYRVTYNPKIHDKVIESLDKEQEVAVQHQKRGVKVLNRDFNVLGRKINVGEKLNDIIKRNAWFVFYYDVVEAGEVIITWSSTGEKSMAKGIYKKLIKRKIKSEFKKGFGKDFYKVKEIKEVKK